MLLEILNLLLVLNSGSFRIESSKVPAFTRFLIFFSGIKSVLP